MKTKLQNEALKKKKKRLHGMINDLPNRLNGWDSKRHGNKRWTNPLPLSILNIY